MSIKGRNSVANLRKTTIYNTKVGLVNDNVYTKFGLYRFIRFQDTCKNEVDQIKNEGARVFTRFLPL